MKKSALLLASLMLSACACPCKEKMGGMDKMAMTPVPAHQVASKAVYTGKCLTAKIEGMMCESCATTVATNLKKLPNVEGVDMDVAKGVAHIHVAKGKRVAVKDVAHTITRSDYVFKGLANGC